MGTMLRQQAMIFPDHMQLRVSCSVWEHWPMHPKASLVATVTFAAPAGPSDRVILESVDPVTLKAAAWHPGKDMTPESSFDIRLLRWTLRRIQWKVSPKRMVRGKELWEHFKSDIRDSMEANSAPVPVSITEGMEREFYRIYEEAFKRTVTWRYWCIWRARKVSEPSDLRMDLLQLSFSKIKNGGK